MDKKAVLLISLMCFISCLLIGQSRSISLVNSGKIVIEEFDTIDSITIDIFNQAQIKMVENFLNEIQPTPTEEQIQQWREYIDSFSVADMMVRDFVSITTLEFDSSWIKKRIKRGKNELPRVDNFNRKKNEFYTTLVIGSDSIKYKTRPLVYFDSLYMITIDTLMKKEIMGYSCYKVFLQEAKQKESELDSLVDFGFNIFEMWVTNKIKLPLYTVFNNMNLSYGNFFALETEEYASKIPGLRRIYRVKEILINDE